MNGKDISERVIKGLAALASEIGDKAFVHCAHKDVGGLVTDLAEFAVTDHPDWISPSLAWAVKGWVNDKRDELGGSVEITVMVNTGVRYGCDEAVCPIVKVTVPVQIRA